MDATNSSLIKFNTKLLLFHGLTEKQNFRIRHNMTFAEFFESQGIHSDPAHYSLASSNYKKKAEFHDTVGAYVAQYVSNERRVYVLYIRKTEPNMTAVNKERRPLLDPETTGIPTDFTNARHLPDNVNVATDTEAYEASEEPSLHAMFQQEGDRAMSIHTQGGGLFADVPGQSNALNAGSQMSDGTEEDLAIHIEEIKPAVGRGLMLNLDNSCVLKVQQELQSLDADTRMQLGEKIPVTTTLMSAFSNLRDY